ncbi:MAG: hypothetical protein NTZ34_04535, partial [Chloroflexi bacterium]|nr:hypothetical protein [Chloroflexota bacterium]
ANWPAVEAPAAVAVPDGEEVIVEGVVGDEEVGVTGVAGAGVAVLQPGTSKLTMKMAATIAIVLLYFILLPRPSVFTSSGERLLK